MVYKSKLFCLGVLAVAYYYRITFSQQMEPGPVVSTGSGKVQGIKGYSRGGRKFFSYLGIPYAKPPTGRRRFEPPEPVDKWDGVLDGSNYGPKCIQVDLLMGNLVGSEDCLTLNIYTPLEARRDMNPFAVIVHFHGGFFHNGGSDFWKPNYLMDEDVIFVSLNFRLGALGFLNTGDDVIRGNMALKDQSLALRWVQDNIGAFGGDPSRVTLLGESAGAVCSHLHVFSPMSKGLFNNVISQSGSALHFWAINQEPRRQAERFAQSLGCPWENSKEMKECLMAKDAATIADIHKELLDPLREGIAIFKPSVEVKSSDGSTFISELPLEMAKRGDYYKVPWIHGVNSEEGLIFSAAMLVNKTMAGVAQDDWEYFLDRTIWYPSPGNTSQKIRSFYFGDSQTITHKKTPPSSDVIHLLLSEEDEQSSNSLSTKYDPLDLDNLESYTNLISDRGFYRDTHHGAALQSQHSPVYLYYYSYRGEWSVVNFFPEVSGTFSRQIEVGWSLLLGWVSKNVLGYKLRNYGASHSDELALMFYMPWVSEIYPENKDYDMSLDIVKLWVEFAQDKENLSFRNVDWPLVNSSQSLPLKYLRLDTSPEVIEEPFTNRIKFWDSLFEEEYEVNTSSLVQSTLLLQSV